ncbi:uncharacterized protein LOC102439541, partial [Myotis lucifugus]|uniref:uncharacterized protein LOC102439541 n=1 Tax=Myotis lucifugus TaxID=59463 RepID=UPI000CCC14F7
HSGSEAELKLGLCRQVWAFVPLTLAPVCQDAGQTSSPSDWGPLHPHPDSWRPSHQLSAGEALWSHLGQVFVALRRNGGPELGRDLPRPWGLHRPGPWACPLCGVTALRRKSQTHPEVAVSARARTACGPAWVLNCGVWPGFESWHLHCSSWTPHCPEPHFPRLPSGLDAALPRRPSWVPLDERIIFSGNLFQYQEDNKKWRNRFSLVPHNYGLVLYENKVAYERHVPPRAVINSAGYKILTSVDQYLELVGNSLPEGSCSGGTVYTGITSKSGTAPILKCPTQFPLILWHPSARHYYFCMMTEAEQEKWQAVLQDCIRHCNNGGSVCGSIILYTKRFRVRFPVRAHTEVVGLISSRGT